MNKFMAYFHFENCTALTKVLFCCLGDILCSFSTAHPKKFRTTYTTMREREVYLITVFSNTVASSYDSVPHSWILQTLDLVGAADNIKRLMRESMESWKTQLTACGKDLGEVSIRRGIFQGDSLSPLLFVIAMLPHSSVLNESAAGYQLSKKEGKITHLLFMDDLKLYGRNEKEINSLVHTVRVFSSDIGMDFGIEKCAMMVMKRGKLDKSEGIRLPDGRIIRSIGDDVEGYKYLGMLEADDIMHDEVKRSMKKEYIRRVKKILSSKLNAGDVIKAINSWAVSLLRYSGAIINWTKSELAELDHKTRKL